MENKQKKNTLKELIKDESLRESFLAELHRPLFNPDRLAILKQGREHWNAWREQQPDLQPDLRDADLSNVDLSDFDLSSTLLR